MALPVSLLIRGETYDMTFARTPNPLRSGYASAPAPPPGSERGTVTCLSRANKFQPLFRKRNTSQILPSPT